VPIGAKDPTDPVDLDYADFNVFIAGDGMRSEDVKISFGSTLKVHGLSLSAAPAHNLQCRPEQKVSWWL